MKDIYNITNPIWVFMLTPKNWLITIPLCYLITTIIFIISLYIVKIENKNEIYKKSIIKVWMFGFLASLIGATLMSIPLFFDIKIAGVSNITTNPYKGFYSTMYLILNVMTNAFIIYFFNKKYSFNKTGLDQIRKKKLSKIITIGTLPYVFFIPTEYILNYISKYF